MKYFSKIVKNNGKFFSAIVLILTIIPMSIFILLFAYFLFYYFGTNSNIEWVRYAVHSIDNIVTQSDYYDNRIISDNIVLNDNKFVITENNGKFNIIMYTKYNEYETIFYDANDWYITSEKKYVVGNGEYAVIYTDNDGIDKCKVLLKTDNSLSKKLMEYSEYITILHNFDEFAEDEQKNLLNPEENTLHIK